MPKINIPKNIFEKIFFQKGGVINSEYLQEDNSGEYVAELEKNEFIKNPNGDIREVIGETHANGGVKLTEEQLPDGSQIISDHLKVGKDGAKRFNNDYDLGVKSTDTYATIIDKFNRKSGIKKIVEEQKIIQNNFKKQALKLETNPASSDTIKLNLELFQDQFQELQDQKTPLEEARKVLFDEVFAPQENSKEEGQHNYKEAQKPIPNSTKQNGGMFNNDMIVGYSQKYNLNPDRVKELMQTHRDGGLQQYQNGTFKVSNNTNVNSKNKRDRQSPNEEAYGITKSEQALQQLYNNFPDIINSDVTFKKHIEVGNNGVIKFKGGVPLNKQATIVGNAQRLMDERMVDSANTIINNPSQFSEEAVKEAQRYLTDETFLANAESEKDATRSIRGYDHKMGDFSAGRYSMQMNLVTPEERKMLNDAGVTTIKQLKASPLRQKLSTSSLANVDKIDGLIGDTNADYGIAEITPEKPALETTKAEAPALKARGYEADISGEDGNGYGMFRPALQQVLLPDSLQGALLKRTKYDRVETPLVSPNQQITELRRQEQSAMQGLQNLPDSQKAAAIAQIQANTQNGINQAVAQTQGSNQQARFNTDVTNAQVQMKEEDMRNNNLQEYENKITTADAKTQANLRNYYNTIEKIRVNADAFDVNQRLIGSMYENTGFNGNELYTKNMEKAKAYDEMANLSEAEKSEKRKKDEATYQKTLKLSVTPVKKRFGGRK